MKIVDLKTFKNLPADTLFSKYEPCIFGELTIKGDSWENDFLVTSSLAAAIEANSSEEMVDLLYRAVETGESLSMDFETLGRDGCYNESQLFAVWEEADVRSLIKRLQRCLPA